MNTRYRILRPDNTAETRTIEMPPEPGYRLLKDLIEPIIKASFEQCAVLADFEDDAEFRRRDMFVDGVGRLKCLPRNEAATTIYRRSALVRTPALDAEHLSFIAGTAVLFDRIVWF